MIWWHANRWCQPVEEDDMIWGGFSSSSVEPSVMTSCQLATPLTPHPIPVRSSSTSSTEKYSNSNVPPHPTPVREVNILPVPFNQSPNLSPPILVLTKTKLPPSLFTINPPPLSPSLPQIFLSYSRFPPLHGLHTWWNICAQDSILKTFLSQPQETSLSFLDNKRFEVSGRGDGSFSGLQGKHLKIIKTPNSWVILNSSLHRKSAQWSNLLP